MVTLGFAPASKRTPMAYAVRGVSTSARYTAGGGSSAKATTTGTSGAAQAWAAASISAIGKVSAPAERAVLAVRSLRAMPYRPGAALSTERLKPMGEGI